MTIKKADELISDLLTISGEDSIAGKEAIKLLESEATTHNLELISKFIESYWRNR